MKLLKDGVLELFEKAQKAKEDIRRETVSEIFIEDMTTVPKYNITNTNIVPIKNQEGI